MKNIIMCVMSFISLMIIFIINILTASINLRNESALSYEHIYGISGAFVYENVYILENGNNYVSFINNNENYLLETISELSDELQGCIADITSENNLITEIEIKETEISGEIIESDSMQIEIEGCEKLYLDENAAIYNISADDSVVNISREELSYYGVARAVIEAGKIVAVITESQAEELISVLITGTGLSGNYHSEIKLSGDEVLSAVWGDDSAWNSLEEGQLIITADDFRDKFGSELTDYTMETEEEREKDNNYLYITCSSGKIGVDSILRNGEVPYYRGNFIIRYSEKGLLLINELSVEEYLCGVVPSEMPAYYPEEALKSQIICARSFAYVQMQGSSFNIYGADVDDSTNCQVYNNQEESTVINRLIEETKGMVIVANGKILKTYYYSTSSGSLALPSDVWGGSSESGYREGLIFAEAIDLSAEDDFYDFITENTISYQAGDGLVTEKYQCYDMDFNWYRWEAFITETEMNEIINSNLSSVISNFPGKVEICSDGELINEQITGIGNITNIEVTSRAKSGIILEMKITGSKKTLVIKYQSAIRKILSYSDMSITLQDESTSLGIEMLPSAFFCIVKATGGFRIIGGGYGHGVGLSQEGAGKMAEAGCSCDEILGAYFDNAEIRIIDNILKEN